MFTLESRVKERVPAWVECDQCKGQGYMYWGGGDMFTAKEEDLHREPCQPCQGSGGRWHEAVTFRYTQPILCYTSLPLKMEDINKTWAKVTRTSFLVRYHDVCTVCNGCYWEPTCDHCNGKIAEPDTATQWEVEG